MTIRSAAILALCVQCISLTVASAQDWPQMVEIDVRFVRASDAQVAAAFGIAEGGTIPGLTSEEAVEAIRILGEQKADFFSSPRLVTKSGLKATVETVRELRYPSKYEHPKEAPEGSFPAEFEVRNVGVTLVIEPQVWSDGEAIDLNLVPEIVSFLGFIDYTEGKSKPADAGSDALGDLLKEPWRRAESGSPSFPRRRCPPQ